MERSIKLGLITYDFAHLKTEQLALRYIEDDRIDEIKIFALSGKLVFFEKLNTVTSLINIESLSKGCYILEINTKGKVVRKKLLKV